MMNERTRVQLLCRILWRTILPCILAGGIGWTHTQIGATARAIVDPPCVWSVGHVTGTGHASYADSDGNAPYVTWRYDGTTTDGEYYLPDDTLLPYLRPGTRIRIQRCRPPFAPVEEALMISH
jgi:hypothetical protein